MSGSLPTTIHQLFEQQVNVSSNAIAIAFDEKLLSYGWLNDQANRLAHRLIRMGITRGTYVGLAMERCPEVVIALLGILKAGGVYVPLDPAYPDERLAFMLQDTAAPIVLAHAPTAARVSSFAGQNTVLNLDSDSVSSEEGSCHNPQTEATGEDLAYVMYTSGSTGRPKGVLVSHQAVVRLVRNTNYCRFGADEVFLHMAPLAFDASTFEIWGPLLNGGRLAICSPGILSLDAIGDVLRRHGVTTLWLTAGLFHLMVDQRPRDLSGVRQLLAGGDVLSPRHVKKALQVLGDQGVVINGYGPTESTTFACCFRMTRDYQVEGNIPIGQPISNTTVYVLDDNLRRVPTGESGDLFIGGMGLATGYLNQPELTRERFITNPFSSDPESRLYRTGDSVRCRQDGNIEFLGRLDNQVKIAGYRIELGEVEAAIQRHPAVLQTVVLALSLASGEKQLIAYVVANAQQDSLAEEIKRQLAACLPAQMVPSHVVLLDQLPLTPNGKVDRAALPSPYLATPVVKGSSDDSSLENRLKAIWSRVLRRDVGLDENFFDLGGSSLQLIEVHSEIVKALGRQISVTVLFEHATVRSCAQRLADHGDSPSVVAAAQRNASKQRLAMARNKKVKVTEHE